MESVKPERTGKKGEREREERARAVRRRVCQWRARPAPPFSLSFSSSPGVSGRAGYAKWTSSKDTAPGPAHRSRAAAPAPAAAVHPRPPPGSAAWAAWHLPLRGEVAATSLSAPPAPAPTPVGPGTRSMTANTRRAPAPPLERAGKETWAWAAPNAASTTAKKARSMSSKVRDPPVMRVPPYQKARA